MKIKRIIAVKDLNFEQLPACAADFIKRVIKKMRYRKKVQADVATELIAHFEDELKECSTDEQKEQKAQLLIDGFGDIKLLAVLLRRAKKRCRPLWRTMFARTCQAIVILFVCSIVYVAWFLSGKPAITTNYVEQLNRLTRPTADESLNAAPLYEKAIELYEASSVGDSNLVVSKYERATLEQKQVMKKWLADNKNILELVIAGSKKPYYWWEYRGGKNIDEVMSIHLPNLAGFRRLAYALRWRALTNAEEGRYEDAFDDIKACYRLGQHLKGNKTLVEQLVGIAIEAFAVQQLRGVVSEYRIDSSILDVLQRDFEEIIADEDFVISFVAEKLSMYDEIQRCFTEDRIGRGHLSLEALRRLPLETYSDSLDYYIVERPLSTYLHILFTHPNKQQTREMTDCFYAFWDKMARKTPGQLHSETIDIEKEAAEIVGDNILLRLLVPVFSLMSKQEYENKDAIEATLTIIAIIRYNKDTGDYPENLKRLVSAGYLKELPIDSFSDNKPFVYKKTDDSFLLYSIGRNFTDDGGGQFVLDERGSKIWVTNEDDWVFWPVTK